MCVHIHPTTDLAPRVLLPEDPGRAFRLAQELLTSPKMFNHNRGLWGYTGIAPDGEPLTIQSTGIGGPSCAIVAEELVSLGARRLLRIGICAALAGSLPLGAMVVVSEAIARDGTSRALSAPSPGGGPPATTGELRLRGSDALLASLSGAARGAVAGPVASTDLFYGVEAFVERWTEAGALAVELEAAALFAVAARRGVEAGCLLVVSRFLDESKGQLEGEDLHAAEARLGEVAAAALRG